MHQLVGSCNPGCAFCAESRKIMERFAGTGDEDGCDAAFDALFDRADRAKAIRVAYGRRRGHR